MPRRTVEFTESEYAHAFFRKVDTLSHPGGCWVWTAAKNEHGYGVSCRQGRMRKAHRQCLAFFGVTIPDGLFVLHECDNPPCVNPAHLRLGTAKDNTQDSKQKRRNNYGERNGMAVLTEAQVREIRTLYDAGESQGSIGCKFGVTSRTVSKIVLRQRWLHVV